MRGAFNKTCDLWYGPHSLDGPPGALYGAAVPCRFVLQTEISQYDFPYSLSHAWLTLDAFEPHVPHTTSPALWLTGTDWEQADRVSIPSGSPQAYFVARKERVTPFVEPPYWRCLLIAISDVVVPPWLPPSPYPPVPPPPVVCTVGGATCMAATPNPLGAGCNYSIGNGVQLWFTYAVPFGTAVNITTLVTLGGAVFDAWHGPNCGGLVPVASWINNSVQPFFNGVPGELLFLRVTGAGPVNNFQVTVV